jgi:hypothetical protein
MSAYVYGCSQDPAHPRREVVHAMREDPEVRCSVCDAVMHRIPQPFKFYNNPADTLMNKLDQGYRNYRIKKARQHA